MGCPGAAGGERKLPKTYSDTGVTLSALSLLRKWCREQEYTKQFLCPRWP